jgi:hypothetical protein
MPKQISRCANRDCEKCLKAGDEVHNYLHNEVKRHGYGHVGDTCVIEFTILCLAVLPHNITIVSALSGVVAVLLESYSAPCVNVHNRVRVPNTCRRNDWSRRYTFHLNAAQTTQIRLFTKHKVNADVLKRTQSKKNRSQWPRGLRRRSAAARLLGLWARIPPGGLTVCRECCVLLGKGLCDELITHPEESYRVWCVVVCDLETS